MISRDPDKTPHMTPELLALAERHDKKVIHVVIDPEGAKVGDNAGLSFLALVDFVPRIGETIRTQNKKYCKVVDVLHGVAPYAPNGETEAFALITNVYAVMSHQEAERV
jgi:hypothetical protein